MRNAMMHVLRERQKRDSVLDSIWRQAWMERSLLWFLTTEGHVFWSFSKNQHVNLLLNMSTCLLSHACLLHIFELLPVDKAIYSRLTEILVHGHSVTSWSCTAVPLLTPYPNISQVHLRPQHLPNQSMVYQVCGFAGLRICGFADSKIAEKQKGRGSVGYQDPLLS